MQHRREIDGLRAVAVIPVILFHAGFKIFSGGFVGVDVFFVISGYLITSIIITQQAGGKFSLKRFYERRARRILPALFFVMLCCAPFAWFWMAPTQFKEFARSLFAVSTFASNILFWRESDYFATAAEEKPLLHTWSLAVEEQYYMLFPLFIVLLWRFGHRPLFRTVMVIAAVSLLLSEYGSRYYPNPNFYLAPTRVWELLAGSLCAFAQFNSEQKRNNVLSALGLALILYAIFGFDETTPFPSLYTLAPVMGTVLIILYGAQGTSTARLLSTGVFVGIGLISYSAYLWHQPLYAFARVASDQAPPETLMLALGATSLMLAYFSWRFIEQPFRQRVSPLLPSRKRILIASVTGALLFMSLGLTAHFDYVRPMHYGSDHEIDTLVESAVLERVNALRSGICHFNGRGKYSEADDFLENWDCTGRTPSYPNLKPTNISIYGDSIAADKAVAVRGIGYEVMQLTGADCSLVPSLMTPQCHEFAERFISEIKNSDIGVIWLANYFQENELTVDKVTEMAEYWNRTGLPIVIFSPMPEFENFRKALFYEERNNKIPYFKIDFESGSDFFSEDIQNVLKKYDFRVINTKEIFCHIADGCAPVLDGKILLTDTHHLSKLGATKFGQLLASSSDLIN